MNDIKFGKLAFMAFFIAVLTLFTGAQTWAQPKFPLRPINFMIPFPPGGWTDSVARPMCDYSTIKIMDQFAVDDVYMDHEQVTKWAMGQVDFFKKFIKEIGMAKP
jgi:tripartite-type tricarboxylate transporter receptor subunit TctC